MDYENLSLNELKSKLSEVGFTEEEIAGFKSKAPIIATLKAVTMQVNAFEETEEENEEEIREKPKKVASLEERLNPNEERELNKRWKTKAQKMKSLLLSQPTVSILVPLEPSEKVGIVEWRTDSKGDKYQIHIGGSIETVQINGFKYFIPKGIYTPVPQAIAEVIAESQQQTLNAGANISLDRIDPLTGRPFSEIL